MKSGVNQNPTYTEIMLVDDDPIDLVINEKMISVHQFAERTLKCGSGYEALEILKKRVEAGQTFPDIILLDFFMPQMNGDEFIEKFEEIRTSSDRGKACKIVVVTALRSPEKKQALAENQSVLMVVNKPLNGATLQEIQIKISAETR